LDHLDGIDVTEFCRYEIVGATPSGEHRLQCVVCDHTTISAYPPERVHTVCRPPPSPEEVLARVRYDLGTGIDDDDWPEVRRRVLVCRGCKQFSGTGCAELGRRCRTGRIRWLERLVMGECEQWGADGVTR